MIYFMHTGTFFEEFLNNESDKDILKAQYVCVSTRIRRKADSKFDNVICLNNTLYPGTTVLNRGTFEDMKDAYHEQLNGQALPLIAELIKGSIEDDLNIIFLCTKNEWKLKYLKWLAEFIIVEFDYPVYNYKKYIQGCPLYEYDKEKVLKSTNSIVESARKNLYEQQRKTKQGRKRIVQEYKSMDKKELKKICKEQELYYKGMSRQEMIGILDAFL